MALFEIKHWNGSVLVTKETDSLKMAVQLAIASGADLYDANLSGANLSGADLSGANLRGADLYDANLRGADLSGADLSGANLSDANLSGANLYDANLRDANLYDANLRDANLRGADLYQVPMLHNKILEAVEHGGTLDMSAWHTCETTHCRAGWAIVLAGDAGRLLESIYGSSLAGALIHQASCPWMEKVPDFQATDESALADIHVCAEREKIEAAK